MNIREAEEFIDRNNPIPYYRLCRHHREFCGSSKPMNIFELMKLIGSEKHDPDFQKIKVDEKYLSYVALKRFINVGCKGFTPTPSMLKGYPWLELARSLREEGFKVPLIVKSIKCERGRVIAIEGKHRIAAISLVDYFDPEYLVPCIMVRVDKIYTCRMFGQRHNNPLEESGYICYDSK